MPKSANRMRDKTRSLQVKLYLAARQNRNRRFHALYDNKDKLPKTRSGKIMRRVLKAWELGLPTGDPPQWKIRGYRSFRHVPD